MQVSLPALKAFDAAARLGSFKAAATELSISPTAVSHHISNLEQRLSVTLFERTARKIKLTSVGLELSAATGHGFQIIDAAIQKIALAEKHITVSTTSSFAALVLIPSLQAFYSRYPDVQVNITSGESIDTHSYHLPVRFGETAKQNADDILSTERFNMFCIAQSAPQYEQAEHLTIYTTNWKNSELPKVPLQAWLELNGLQNKPVTVRTFDQELFGIQQAMLENALVFCSTTLVNGYVKAGVLKALNTRAVDSALCYYIADKAKRCDRHNVKFIEWLENLINN
ncbi:LysR family transcriptional regulator [Alteromonas lipolytica]|uniref:LysR family transcriptional regulator n=1 Tax=Alteromonas lipolytica TaxID=1856405 RepID=A0A1E8FCK0_9ALTE|nr:LysR family transcriptional regulator [Alteromonas lipolytica]OFI33654.1 LysR family transcriptional regulator [Alteromonas lipolytica]GGF69583.1 LysR family transcriptional regulator [Alteromonas lipolytica]